MILNISDVDAKYISDVIVSFSIIDNFLTNYILEYNKLTNGKAFAEETDKINEKRLRMKEKIQCFCDIFPNYLTQDGVKIADVKSNLSKMNYFRKEIAHNRRFSFENGTSIPEKYQKNEEPLSKIHEQFEKNFKTFKPVLDAFYSDWEYREYYLFNIEGEIYGK